MTTPVPFVLRSSSRQRRLILLVVLLAFGLAQALAVAHAARHAGGDLSGLPASGHVQLCTDCASMLPLLTLAGGVGLALALLRPAGSSVLGATTTRPARASVHPAFRSRAPPTLPR